MIFRKVLSILIVCSFFLLAAPSQTAFPDLLRLVPLTSVVFAQDLSKTVLPITEFKLKLKPKKSFPSSVDLAALKPKITLGEEADFGTGFCLDPECRLIGTNYHVAMMVRPRKIKGAEVMERYLATGPEDEGATLNDIFSERPMKYTLSRDLAIFELRRPLPNYHGITFSLDDLEIDQQVDIYAYPKESINPIRSLLQFHGAYKGKTTAGFSAFEYSFSNGTAIRGGASGGLVVDSRTQRIVGVLSRAGEGKNGKPVALAVPIQSLADFVSKAQPWLAQSLFPSANREIISPALADLYPRFEFAQPPAADSLGKTLPYFGIGFLQHRPEEPVDVKVLREKAQLLADSIRNFVAVQTFAFGSGGNNVPFAMAAYEVQVLDGYQRFREYPDGKKEFQDVPLSSINTGVGTGGEWSELPKMVGTAPRFKIHQFPDTVVNGRRIKVFQYRAEVEDGICVFKSITDFVFFTTSKDFTVPCYGEVWTDQDTNILRISGHLEMSGKDKWRDYYSVVTYGWLRRSDEAPRLIPLTISAQAELNKKKVYWCRGAFTNYRVFSSRTKIIANDYVQSLPP